MQERFQTFTVLIGRIARFIRRIETEEMAGFRLKSSHVSCLYYLYEKGSLTAKELCDICDEDKAAVSRAIEYLEREGFLTARVEAFETAKKRYKTPLALTEKGRQAGAFIARKINDVLREASAGVSDEDRARLYKSLEAISESLQKICEKYEGEKNG